MVSQQDSLLRLWIASLLWLGLAGPATGQVARVKFLSRPEGAEIYQYDGGKWDYLGRSGSTVSLVEGSWVNNQVQLRFELPGYRTIEATYTLDLRSPDAPMAPVELQPVTLLSWLQTWRWLLAGVALVVAAGGMAWMRLRFRMRRAERLLGLVEDSDPLVGSRLGAWRLMGRLGGGGMGAVYEAAPDADLHGPTVAVKILHGRDPSLLAPEVRAMLALDHPGIVRLLDWGIVHDTAYLVSERVSGDRLRQFIPDTGLAVESVLPWLVALADAVSYAHQEGVIHRDLKPDNVLVDELGHLHVIDFGLALQTHGEQQTEGGSGTVGYASPEQLSGQPVDERTDQYSLGIMAWEMLVGHAPGPAGNAIRLLAAHLASDPWPPPSSVRPDIPEWLDVLVSRMIAKPATQRYGSLADVFDVVAAHVSQRSRSTPSNREDV